MAWQVYDFMEPDYVPGIGYPHGPLPRKRWIPHPNDPKPRKVKSRPSRDSLSKREYNERTAVGYATWLAKRDGIEIPYCGYGGKVICQWSSVESHGKTRRQRFWNGTRQVQVYEDRVRSVQWCHAEEIYNTRKDGKRGAYLYTRYVPELTIEIPHWDHVPDVIEEHDVVCIHPVTFESMRSDAA